MIKFNRSGIFWGCWIKKTPVIYAWYILARLACYVKEPGLWSSSIVVDSHSLQKGRWRYRLHRYKDDSPTLNHMSLYLAAAPRTSIILLPPLVTILRTTRLEVLSVFERQSKWRRNNCDALLQKWEEGCCWNGDLGRRRRVLVMHHRQWPRERYLPFVRECQNGWHEATLQNGLPFGRITRPLSYRKYSPRRVLNEIFVN
jgi:hypothetical protein